MINQIMPARNSGFFLSLTIWTLFFAGFYWAVDHVDLLLEIVTS